MAEGGARVVVLERETEFRDRIRGEALVPWGVGEARQLGVVDILRSCAQEMRWVQLSINGQVAMKRDLFATTPQGAGFWGFYHPGGEEALVRGGGKAGAEVRRGATVRRIVPGEKPRVEVAQNSGEVVELEGRLVAYCAGRNPALRTELGFEPRRGSIPLLLSGIWVAALPAEADASVAYISNDVVNG